MHNSDDYTASSIVTKTDTYQVQKHQKQNQTWLPCPHLEFSLSPLSTRCFKPCIQICHSAHQLHQCTCSMVSLHGKLHFDAYNMVRGAKNQKTDLAKYIPAVCSAKLMPVFLDMLNVKCGISKPCTMWDNSAEKFMWRNANTDANWVFVCMLSNQPTEGCHLWIVLNCNRSQNPTFTLMILRSIFDLTPSAYSTQLMTRNLQLKPHLFHRWCCS